MPGYRIGRNTNSSNYRAVNGTIKIPTYYAVKPESYAGAQDGVFLEFFYVFQAKDTANTYIDIGILNNGVTWKMFAGGSAIQGGWHDGSSLSLQPDDLIDMAVSLIGNNTIQLKVTKNGKEYPMNVALKSAAVYNTFHSGVEIRREMNIVPQARVGQILGRCSYLPSNVYYMSAEWHNTTLTTTSGSYVFITKSNSHVVKNKDSGTSAQDNEYDDTSYVSSISEATSSATGAVSDLCSIDFRNRSHCK